MHNGHSLITHVNRLKPYNVPLDGSHEFKDNTAVVQPSPTDKRQPQKEMLKMTFMMTKMLCPSLNHNHGPFHFPLSLWLGLQLLLMMCQ